MVGLEGMSDDRGVGLRLCVPSYPQMWMSAPLLPTTALISATTHLDPTTATVGMGLNWRKMIVNVQVSVQWSVYSGQCTGQCTGVSVQGSVYSG